MGNILNFKSHAENLCKKSLAKNLGISKTIKVPKRQAKELTLIRLGFLKVVFFCEGINLTNPKKQGFTPSLENAVLEKPQGGDQIAPAFLGLIFKSQIRIFCYLDCPRPTLGYYLEGKPNSTDVNHCVLTSSTRRSPGNS